MRRLRALAVAAMWGVACVPRGVAAGPGVYGNRADGVSFSYPAGWLLNGDDDAATAKLRIVDLGQPAAVVQLEGNFAGKGLYTGTDFEAGAFAYLMLPGGGGEAACFGLLDANVGGISTREPGRWNGMRARQVEPAFSVAGTEDRHRLVAVYRNARCYLFETVVVSHAPDAAERPLSAARWGQIRAAFAGVMDSVRVGRVAER